MSSSQEWTVADEDAGVRLDKYVAAPGRLGSRRRVSTALERGQVFVNGREATLADAKSRLARNDVIRLWMDRPGSAKRRFRPTDLGDLRILYEDDALIVVNKPAGLLTVPLERTSDADSVYDRVREYLRTRGKRRVFVVHRIDRDTSGLVVFAKDTRTREHLRDQFRQRQPERVYWAVVSGHPQPAEGTWSDRLKWDRKALIQKPTSSTDRTGSEAISQYRVVETFKDSSLVEIQLRTGKQNQIRVQAQLRGHPLVGERRYVPEGDMREPIAFPHQALHACRLEFRHPVDERPVRFEAPVPQDFADLIKRLRRTRTLARG